MFNETPAFFCSASTRQGTSAHPSPLGGRGRTDERGQSRTGEPAPHEHGTGKESVAEKNEGAPPWRKIEYPAEKRGRHGCGYKLANDGHDTRAIQHYLGHKNIQHTVRYTELSAERFKGFWGD